MVSAMTTHFPSSLVAHAGGKLCEHLTRTQTRYPGIDLVRRSEAKTHLDPQGLSHHVGSPDLGRSGLFVSRLCLGTMNFGPQTEEAAAHSIMDSAQESGINFFDTANVYGGTEHRGWTEEILGRWFAKGGERREKTVLATKLFGGQTDHRWTTAEAANPIKLAMGQGDRERVGEDRRDTGTRLSDQHQPRPTDQGPRRTATRKRQPGRRHTPKAISSRPPP